MNKKINKLNSLYLQSLNGGKPQFSGLISSRELITSSAVLNSAVFLGTDGTAITCIPAAFPAVTPGLAQPLLIMLREFYLLKYFMLHQNFEPAKGTVSEKIQMVCLMSAQKNYTCTGIQGRENKHFFGRNSKCRARLCISKQSQQDCAIVPYFDAKIICQITLFSS